MKTLREYKNFLKERYNMEYVQGENNPWVETFAEFQKMNYNPLDGMYNDLERANEAWYKAELAGQDVINDIYCDGYHARRNAMRICHRIEELEGRK